MRLNQSTDLVLKVSRFAIPTISKTSSEIAYKHANSEKAIIHLLTASRHFSLTNYTFHS